MEVGTDRASAGGNVTRGSSVGGSLEFTETGVAGELRRARTAARWARWRLAHESGVPKKVIADIEKGVLENPEPATLRALREALPAERRVPRYAALGRDARRALSKARREAGLSGARVERLCGLQSGVVSGLEAGTRGISAEAFARVLAAIRENAEPEPAGIGGKLRRARYAEGLSRDELADLSRIWIETIRDIETARTHRPKKETLAALFGALGRPVPEWAPPLDAPRPGQRSKGRFVGERLILARVAAGLTQGVLAKRIGVSSALVSVLERDELRCTPDVLDGLCEALGAHGFPWLDPEALASDLGARVRRRRVALGLSEEALAGVARVSAGDVGRAERGSAWGAREAAVLLARLGAALKLEEALTGAGAPSASGGALGAGLRSARIERSLSPGALAERVGVTRGMIRGYEEGWHLPGVRTLEALGDALGVEDGTAWLEEARAEAHGRQGSKVPTRPRRPPADNALSRELRAARLGRGLTLRELGERAGVGVMTVHHIEVAGGRPRPATLDKLCRALGHELPEPKTPPAVDAAAFAAARRRAGLSQQALGERAGVASLTVWSLENGRTKRPRRDSLRKIGAVLAPYGLDA